ncbi:MAG: hypothetical protein H8Z69_00375 [Nanohaloarchaea archaeon]|nr:hypothetical protein [Candidatus Nanohaloarchaea archaeon]
MDMVIGKKRKGVGYIIEAMLAIITLFIFALGNTAPEPSQNWSNFQIETTANDLGQTLKITGDMQSFMKRDDTESLQYAVEELSSEQLKVSGTVENLPLKESTIGFNTSSNVPGSQPFDLERVENGDQCSDDLEEIETKEPILRTVQENSGKYGERIYVADTDPDVTGGFDNTLDYDSLWIDNQSTCQFSTSEGPYYLDEIFEWTGPTDRSFDIKKLDQNQMVLHRADIPTDIREVLAEDVNGIRTTQRVDTTKLNTDLSIYDVLVFSRESEDYLNNYRSKLKDYLENGGRIMLLMDIERSELNTGFLDDSGLKWIDMSKEKNVDSALFTGSRNSEKIETYFKGLEGDTSQISLRTGGKVVASNSGTMFDQKQLMTSSDRIYDTDDWNATNWNMQPANPQTNPGHPESACYSTGSDAFTEGTFEFPLHQQPGTVSYNVINTEMGNSVTVCNEENARALSIDFDRDGDYGDEREGPYLNGETLEVENKSYRAFFPDTQSLEDGDVAMFDFMPEGKAELINYRTSFEDQNGQLVRIDYQNYDEADYKLISSLIYWLEGHNKQFGSEKSSSIGTKVVGGISDTTYIPYKVSLRWTR